MTTKIEWTHRPGTIGVTWNPVSGCTKISEGCQNCYAQRMAKRLAGRCGYPAAPHQFDVTLHEDKLDQPLYWKTPRTVFVCSMSDLFHPRVPLKHQVAVFRVIEQCPQHTFLMLTKRPEQMLLLEHIGGFPIYPNLWIGVTAENQRAADERIGVLLQIPAAVHFVSVEPMLGPVDIQHWLGDNYSSLHGGFDDGISWTICGGESGPGARPMHPDWARGLRDQCQNAGVRYFFKQWGNWIPESNVNTRWERGQQRSAEGMWPESASGELVSAPSKTPPVHLWPDGSTSIRYAKRRTGRELDGREWNEYPEVDDGGE